MTTKRYASDKEHRWQTRFEPVNESGTKMKKRAKKHRLDSSNPGGVVSEYFRAKNSKIME